MNRRPKALSFSGGGTKFAWQIEIAEEWLSCSRSLEYPLQLPDADELVSLIASRIHPSPEHFWGAIELKAISWAYKAKAVETTITLNMLCDNSIKDVPFSVTIVFPGDLEYEGNGNFANVAEMTLLGAIADCAFEAVNNSMRAEVRYEQLNLV